VALKGKKKVSLSFMHSELSSFYHLLTLKEEIPHFRNLRFKNITGNALEAGYIIGLKESVIRNLTLTDIDLDTKVGWTCFSVTGMSERVEPDIGRCFRF
jgi:hypothetical protein